MVCGVSAISGTRTIAPLPRSSAARGRLQVDLGLAGAGHAVEQEGAAAAAAILGEPGDDGIERDRWAPVSSTPSRTAPTPGEWWRRRRSTSRVATRPRASSRRSVARSEPAVAASSRAAFGPASRAREHRSLSQPEGARRRRSPRCPSRSPRRRARPAGGRGAPPPRCRRREAARGQGPAPEWSSTPRRSSGPARPAPAAPRPRAPPAAPPAGRSASSLRSASPTTTPTTRRRPKGTTSTEPTSTSSIASGTR